MTTFARTGLHLDFRIQVMPMPALRALAREAASLGHNTLMIEWEGAYPFAKHVLISNRYAYTREELTGFIAECTRLGLDVIPLQQCFGHIEYILRHDRYAHLRESDSDICQLCPCRIDEALAIFTDIFRDIAATHPSPFIHIGGDETCLLGHCPACRAKAEKYGKSRLYVDYFKQVADLIVSLGKCPVLWADMLLKNSEAAADMPRGSVFVDWNYGWPVNHFGDLEKLRSTAGKAGFEFWGAPALRSSPDNHALTCWRTHFDNLRDFLPFARDAGYRGMILTSWSTSGIYGYQRDHAEFVDILPVRRVYPLSGFDILKQAFRVALDATDASQPFVPEAFVINYARTRFGLGDHGGRALWRALNADMRPASPGIDLAMLHRSARAASHLLASLRPRRHATEFAHLRLMADLREFHLRFKIAELRFQSAWFTAARRPAAVRLLAGLLKESDALDRRFARLNRGFLYPEELAEETRYRSARLRHLHARLARTGRGCTPALS
ncbi:N-acetyl-beta-hexosaminidase [Opitutaceae bacterium TAV1]|nr:N-acetyl-beta-hexosaminidase [Opitutaceae bacterium TAV1]